MIPYGRQSIDKEDIDAVLKVLKSDFLTQGPCVPLFEKEITTKVGAEYGIAVNSATSALHIACMSLNLKPGDWLWTSPITFVASANCGVYCGANIDFVDIDPVTFTLCPVELEKKLVSAEAKGKLPKIVIAVHLAGQSCNMEKIFNLSKRYDFKVIEDASHAIGAKYQEEYIGNCRYSDIAIFSFHPVKIITSAEGGIALTNNKVLADNMRLHRSHGITRNKELMEEKTPAPWYYEQIDIGFNYRMTDLQAALGMSQLAKLDYFVTKRNNIAKRYNKLLADLPLSLPVINPDNYSAFHLYIVQIKIEELEISQKEIFNYLIRNGINVNLHYIPVHTQPFFRKLGFKKNDFHKSMAYYSKAISLPIYPALEEQQQEFIILKMRELIQNKS